MEARECGREGSSGKWSNIWEEMLGVSSAASLGEKKLRIGEPGADGVGEKSHEDVRDTKDDIVGTRPGGGQL